MTKFQNDEYINNKKLNYIVLVELLIINAAKLHLF
jgi:hypothetical protein